MAALPGSFCRVTAGPPITTSQVKLTSRLSSEVEEQVSQACHEGAANQYGRCPPCKGFALFGVHRVGLADRVLQCKLRTGDDHAG
jgi:hypothetical protein